MVNVVGFVQSPAQGVAGPIAPVYSRRLGEPVPAPITSLGVASAISCAATVAGADPGLAPR